MGEYQYTPAACATRSSHSASGLQQHYLAMGSWRLAARAHASQLNTITEREIYEHAVQVLLDGVAAAIGAHRA